MANRSCWHQVGRSRQITLHVAAAIEKARTKRAERCELTIFADEFSGSPRCGAAGSRYRSRASVSLGFIHAGSPPSWDLDALGNSAMRLAVQDRG